MGPTFRISEDLESLNDLFKRQEIRDKYEPTVPASCFLKNNKFFSNFLMPAGWDFGIPSHKNKIGNNDLH